MVEFTDITLHIAHVNRAAQQSISQPIAFKLRAGAIVYSPNEPLRADIDRRLTKSRTDPLTLAPLIRAFRAQLAITAPELVLRKWMLFCGFEGARRGSSVAGSSKRFIPMFRVDLPSSVTAETPAMTPAATAEGPTDAADGCASVPATFLKVATQRQIEDEDVPSTLQSLLIPFVSNSDLEMFAWSARLSFVVGEDEEEERKRREDLKASAVNFSTLPKQNSCDEFTEADEFDLETRLDRYPPSMRNQMRSLVREQIIAEKKGNIKGGGFAPAPSTGLFGGGFGGQSLFGGGGGFTFGSGDIQSSGYPPNFLSGAAFAGSKAVDGTGLFAHSKKQAYTVAKAAAAPVKATGIGGLFSQAQQVQPQPTGGWSFGTPMQGPTQGYTSLFGNQ